MADLGEIRSHGAIKQKGPVLFEPSDKSAFTHNLPPFGCLSHWPNTFLAAATDSLASLQ